MLNNRINVFLDLVENTSYVEPVTAWLSYAPSMVNATADGGSPLMAAAARRDSVAVALVKELVDKGADIDATDATGSTALLVCVECATNCGVAKTLLDLGADPNIGDSDGYYPFHAACKATVDPNILSLLIDANANVFHPFPQEEVVDCGGWNADAIAMIQRVKRTYSSY